MEHKADPSVGLAKFRSEFPVFDLIHSYDVDPNTREIYLVGREEYTFGEPLAQPEPGVDYLLANRFIKNIRALQALDSDGDILIHMKTCGGFWEEGMAIYDAIRACPNYVTILNYTHARSMSSLIFQAADYRAMMPYSTFMFHEGTYEFDGTAKSLDSHVEQHIIARQQMLDIYIDKMREREGQKWSRKRLQGWLKDQMNRKEDVFLSADDAVKYGFADAVFGGDGKYDWTTLRSP